MTTGWQITLGSLLGIVIVCVAAWLWDRWLP